MRRWHSTVTVAALVLAGACAEGTGPTAPAARELRPGSLRLARIVWDGNGAAGGVCNTIYYPGDAGYKVPPGVSLPAEGKQLWHFILSKPIDPTSGNALDATFDDGHIYTNVAQSDASEGSAHFYVLSNVGAKLLSASAVDGDGPPPPESNLTVSHCLVTPTTVRPAANLTVSKDGAGTYDKRWAYNVVKTSDAASIVRTSAASFTINYTVTATRTGPTLSNFAVSGTITVSNPNLGSVTLATLTDAMGGVDCTVDVSGGLSIPAGALVSDVMVPGTKQYPYSCSLPGKTDASEVSNKVTATWATQTPANTGELKEGSTDFTFGISFTGHDVNPTADVYDAYNGGDAQKIGTISTDGPVEFKFSKSVTVPVNACVVVSNSARVEESTSSVSNTICANQTGGLTIGYWSQTNGQKTINALGATGKCSWTDAIYAYNAFKDLNSAATCAQLAAYVSTVIKNANASGASMAAMLKAQMLATVLSVQKNASLGNAAIDLSKVCTDLTCTAYENVGPAGFTGASKKVSELLAIADSHVLDAGGWYGGVKLTQELAKDTFDMINNNLATIYAGP